MKARKQQQTKPAFNLILLGDPGAGKATQAAYLAKKYRMFDYDMGRELTLLREKDKTIEDAQKRTADKGNLTPTTIVRKINRQTILKMPSDQGILFDGHPKMLGEAKLIAKLLKEKKRMDPLVLYIKIPVQEVIDRVQKRKGYFNTKFSKRGDDTEAGLRNRAKYYRKNVSQVVKFFKSQYTYKSIDGMGSKTEVRLKIQKAIDNYLKKQS